MLGVVTCVVVVGLVVEVDVDVDVVAAAAEPAGVLFDDDVLGENGADEPAGDEVVVLVELPDPPDPAVGALVPGVAVPVGVGTVPVMDEMVPAPDVGNAAVGRLGADSGVRVLGEPEVTVGPSMADDPDWPVLGGPEVARSVVQPAAIRARASHAARRPLRLTTRRPASRPLPTPR